MAHIYSHRYTTLSTALLLPTIKVFYHFHDNTEVVYTDKTSFNLLFASLVYSVDFINTKKMAFH